MSQDYHALLYVLACMQHWHYRRTSERLHNRTFNSAAALLEI